MVLTGKQRRHLRGLGHHLDAVVQVGKLGVTEAVVAAADAALATHELIKVRCGTECPLDRDEVGAALTTALAAELVQKLGRTLLLYRADPERPRIALP
jgi:RNA-binding protein